MDFYKKKIMVVGGAGFIGSHLVDSLILENPAEIHVVDNLFLGRKENLHEAKQKFTGLRFHKMDATKGRLLRNLIRREKIDFVFNLATKALGYSFDNPPDAFHVNVQIVGHLLESLRLSEIKYLVHFSSSEAYGSAVKIPMREDHPLRPCTPYAAGKAAADLMIHAYQETFGLHILIVRPFNNYGSRQNVGLYAGVIPITIRRLCDRKAPLVHGDGTQTRDFVYVGDTVRIVLELSKQENNFGKVINIGTGLETSINEIISHLCAVAGFSSKRIQKEFSRIGDVKRHCADTRLLHSIIPNLLFKPITEGLSETWEWYFRSIKT